MAEYKNIAPLEPHEREQWVNYKRAETHHTTSASSGEPLDVHSIEEEIAAESRVRKLKGGTGTQEALNAEDLKLSIETGLSKEQRSNIGTSLNELRDSMKGQL